MKTNRVIAAFLVLTGLTYLRAQTLEVTPSRILVDEAAAIRATGLQPNEHVTIQANLTDGADQQWDSQGEFTADSQGVVDTAKQAPVAGSYKAVSAMGLIWSMMPASKDAAAYNPPKRLEAQTIQFQLIRKGKSVSRANLEQLWISAEVRRTNLEGVLHGVLLEPASSEPHPGVLVLGGSEGGIPIRPAAWLASRGYAALALAYFRFANLPRKLEAIPLEYFGQALGWMSKCPEIASDRIGVVGSSRGGELALQLASLYSTIRAVVAYVPANTRHPACCGGTSVPYAWTWKGAPLPFVFLRNPRDLERLREATIPVEQISGPILLISGQGDEIWESSPMSKEIVSRLKRAHFVYSVEHLEYSHAGHRAGHPAIIPAWQGKVRHPVSGREITFGGTPEGNAESSLDAISKVLDFLRQNLGGPAAGH